MVLTDASGRMMIYSVAFLLFIFLGIIVYFLAGVLLLYVKKLLKEKDGPENVLKFCKIVSTACVIFGILMFCLHLLPFLKYLLI